MGEEEDIVRQTRKGWRDGGGGVMVVLEWPCAN